MSIRGGTVKNKARVGRLSLGGTCRERETENVLCGGWTVCDCVGSFRKLARVTFFTQTCTFFCRWVLKTVDWLERRAGGDCFVRTFREIAQE